MPERAQRAARHAALKRRREEVAARLAACGLARGPRRLMRGDTGNAQTRASRLRSVLEDLGPVFSCFGLYMATRVDLLSARDCLELGAIPDRGAPAPPATVRELFRREVGCAPEEALSAFEDEPFKSRLLYQSHRARLMGGTPVVVKFIRPEAERRFLCDVELLPMLEGALGGAAAGGALFRSAAADFAAALRQQMDFTHEAKALGTLARDAEDFGPLRVPVVEYSLSATRVMVVEELDGRRLDEAEFAGGAVGERESPQWQGPPNVYDRASLARLLCSTWLRQALLGRVFPAELSPANVVVLSDKQIVFTGGLFAALPAESQSKLWDYLIAAAADEPDRARSCLLGELRLEGAPGGEEDLRHRFRQVVPFRDSEWHRDGDDLNRLAEHLVVHWRAAAECGYIPRPHLPSFYRGLFAVAGLAQRLSPEGDPLLEGLQDARLLAGLRQMRQLISPQRLGDHFDKYAAMMTGLPQRFDDMLTLASGSGPRVKLHMPEAASRRRRKNSAAAFAALLLIFAAAVLLLPRVTAALVVKEWADRVNAAAFIACGAVLLRAAVGTR